MNKISVIGAGNGGMTAGYHFSKMGQEVCIYDSPKFDKQIKAVNEKGGIEALTEANGCNLLLPGFEKIFKATTDIKEAVEFSNILVMICPSFAQELLFKDMLPHLKDGQIVILVPGNYGSFVLDNMLRKSEYSNISITFVDTASLPWACRIVGDAQISIMGLKEFMPLSIYPASHETQKLKELIGSVFPKPVEFLGNPITSALENINFGGHPLFTILNMGVMENYEGDFPDGFNFYRDTCSVATAKAEEKLEEERVMVATAY